MSRILKQILTIITLFSVASDAFYLTDPNTIKFIQENCKCEMPWVCRCCLPLRNDGFLFHQNFCANWTIIPRTLDAQLDLFANDVKILNVHFDQTSLIPLCVPLLQPLPAFVCLKLRGTKEVQAEKLIACLHFTVDIFGEEFVDLQLGCTDLGIRSIATIIEKRRQQDLSIKDIK